MLWLIPILIFDVHNIHSRQLSKSLYVAQYEKYNSQRIYDIHVVKREISIRWHGRGGQGAVTAAQVVATCAIVKGLYAQAFPEFGPERRGAPVKAYTRLSTRPIRHREPILNPDYLVILDPSLLELSATLEGVHDDTIIIVNSPDLPDVLKNKNFRKIVYIDATDVAMKTIGRPIVNTAILGALLKALDLITVEDVLKGLEKFFSGKLLEVNKKAVVEAYNLARVIG